MVVVDHVEGKIGISIAVHWLHQGWMSHGRIEGKVLVHWHAGMASKGIWVVKIVHDRGTKGKTIGFKAVEGLLLGREAGWSRAEMRSGSGSIIIV